MPSKPAQPPRASKVTGLKTWWANLEKARFGKAIGAFTSTQKPVRTVFGTPLKESLKYASLQISTSNTSGELYVWGYIPIVVAQCGLYLKENATEIPGTFSVAGSDERMEKLQALFEAPPRYGKHVIAWKQESYTTYDIASVFRKYLTQLPEPVIPHAMYHAVQDGLAKQPFNQGEVIATYRRLIRSMPRANQYLLLYVLDLLSVFARRSDKNLMTAAELAVIFRPGLLSHPVHKSPADHDLSQRILEFLIAQQDWEPFALGGAWNLVSGKNAPTIAQWNTTADPAEGIGRGVEADLSPEKEDGPSVTRRRTLPSGRTHITRWNTTADPTEGTGRGAEADPPPGSTSVTRRPTLPSGRTHTVKPRRQRRPDNVPQTSRSALRPSTREDLDTGNVQHAVAEIDLSVQPADPALLHKPSTQLEARVRSEGDHHINSLLESWEHQQLLMLPDRQGLSNSSTQQREKLRDVEKQVGIFLVLVLDSREARRAARRLEGRDARLFVDTVQDVLNRGTLPNATYRSTARQLMQKVSEAVEHLPSSLFISGVNDHDEYPTFGGGFGDVYQASYEGRMVALKRIRTFTADSTTHRNRLQFYKEALVWQGLSHRFILPLLGIDRSTFAPSFCMVSPWMKHGTVLKYIRNHGRGDVNRLLHEIAQGLDYLHAMNIVHGDLRGTNVLISDDGNACLADFGLTTTIFEADSTVGGLTSSSNHGGSVRWWAPELIQPKSFGCERFSRTTASDVYAYACVCLELYTGSPPFARLPDVAAMLKVIGGDRPERPSNMSAALWDLVTAGWVPDFCARPNIHDIALALESIPAIFSA